MSFIETLEKTVDCRDSEVKLIRKQLDHWSLQQTQMCQRPKNPHFRFGQTILLLFYQIILFFFRTIKIENLNFMLSFNILDHTFHSVGSLISTGFKYYSEESVRKAVRW